MRLSDIPITSVDCEIVSKVLFSIPKDEYVKGDIIFVFGTKRDYKDRMDVAIKLYKEGYAPLIFLSGGMSLNDSVEALVMKDYAIKNGVLEKDILIETESLNTTENVLSSLLVLHRAFLLPKIKKMLIVSGPHHIRRCMLTLSKYMPRGIEFYYYYNENSVYSSKNWLKDEEAKETLINEVKNTIKYIKEGIIDDVDLSI